MNDLKGFIDLGKQTSKRAGGEIVARLLVDTKSQKIFCIWKDINHPEYLAEHLKTSVEWLKKNLDIASDFVGAAVMIENDEVTGIIVGISGLEILMQKFKKPFHTKNQVISAKTILISYLIDVGMAFKTGYKVEVKFL